jgi:hypothetical protein
LIRELTELQQITGITFSDEHVVIEIPGLLGWKKVVLEIRRALNSRKWIVYNPELGRTYLLKKHPWDPRYTIMEVVTEETPYGAGSVEA